MQREVVEAQRDPAPPHAGELVGPARGLGLADGPDAPRAVAGRGEPVGRDADRLAVDAELALPRADAREARRVEQDAVALAADVLRLGDRSVLGAVHEVEAEAVLVGVADDAQLAERLDHLDAVGPDLLRSCWSSGRAPDVRIAHCLSPRRTVAYASMTPRFGYTPSPVMKYVVGLVVDALVDAPVVDVAVAGRGVPHRQRDLMDRVLVERIELEHRRKLLRPT